MDIRTRSLNLLIVLSAVIGLVGLVSQAFARHGEVPSRIAEPAPYNIEEAGFYGGYTGHAPPFERSWNSDNDPGKCSGCHDRIFDEWNGSMMANAWRDPGWRGAFLLVARATATDGCGDINENLNAQGEALDGTVAYGCNAFNPFAVDGSNSTFKTVVNGVDVDHPTDGSGSLMDDFCSRCHMPTNYTDAVPLAGVNPDDLGDGSNFEHGPVIPTFDPTSSAGTTEAYATIVDTAQSLYRNTDSGKQGIFCEVCHTNADSRRTPYSYYEKSGTDYVPAQGRGSRIGILDGDPNIDPQYWTGDMPNVPDANVTNLGYAIGAGAYRLSPHALGAPERFGPIFDGVFAGNDPYVSGTFQTNIPYQDEGDLSRHAGYYQVKFERAEFCGACHDVTNPMTIKNENGHWVGGFPIERTYTEWSNSRYANRIDENTGVVQANFDPDFQRDCQTCHMQQDFGQPGTAQTLNPGGVAIAAITGKACGAGSVRDVFYTHHFVGGNGYIPDMIGASLTSNGGVEPYPVLAGASFTSANKGSKYHYAYFDTTSAGPASAQGRMAWDRVRNAVEIDLSAAANASAGQTVSISTLAVTNSGSGHNFPTGFPEGRAAWVAVRAFDTGTGAELMIQDNRWNRTAMGVGYLTDVADVVDPNYPGCNWKVPAGSPDPWAYTFKAVASLGEDAAGNTCPTLALPYATPLNIVANANGVPIDSSNVPIEKNNPRGIPQYTDEHAFQGNVADVTEMAADGEDVFDGAFLTDTRLSPIPLSGSTVDLGGAYAVIIPSNAVGPIAVTAVVYYQAFEAIVSEKFLGNLANTDLDAESAAYLAGTGPLPILEPCVLKGACDGRTPSVEPAVVEGAPPVPAEVKSWVINLAADNTAPTVTFQYPAPGATDVYSNFVAKVGFSEPVDGVESAFTLLDTGGNPVPARVAQISDGTWGLFSDAIFLSSNASYTLQLGSVCDFTLSNCTAPTSWSFQTSSGAGSGDTTNPLGFGAAVPPPLDDAPTVTAVDPADQSIDVAVATNVNVTFSEAVDNVTAASFTLNEDGGVGDCSTLGASVTGAVSGAGGSWTLDPNADLANSAVYCVTVTTAVTDSDAIDPPDNMAADFTSQFTTVAGGGGDPVPFVATIDPADGAGSVLRNSVITATFSEDVTNVTASTFLLKEADKADCAVTVADIAGTVNGAGDTFTFTPGAQLGARTTYCVTITSAVVDSAAQGLDPTHNSQFKTGNN